MRTVLNLSMQTKRGDCFCRTVKPFSAQTQIETFPRGYLPNLYYEPQLQLVGRRQSIVCNNGTRGTFSLNSLFPLLDPLTQCIEWANVIFNSIAMNCTRITTCIPKKLCHILNGWIIATFHEWKLNGTNLMYRRKTKGVFEVLDSSELSFRFCGDMIRSDNGVKGRWKHR